MKYVRPSMKHHVSQGTKTLLLWRTWRNVTRFTRRVARMLSTTVTGRSQRRFAPISQSRSATLSPRLSTRSCRTPPVRGSPSRPALPTTVTLSLAQYSVTTRPWISVLIRFDFSFKGSDYILCPSQRRCVTFNLKECVNKFTG